MKNNAIHRHHNGFTLIELLIVMVIVGILVTLAIPAYRQHVIDTSRATAVADAQELSLFLERAFSAQGRYDNAASAGNLVNPLPFTSSPQNDANVKYTLSLATLTATTFTLRAVPGSGQNSDSDCGELRLNQAGVQCIKGGTVCSNSASSTDRAAVAACW